MRSLYLKISVTFLVLLIVTGLSCAGIWIFLWHRFMLSSEQFLHWNTAAIVRAEIEPLLGDSPDTPSLLNAFRRLKQLNPRCDPFIVSSDGTVLLQLNATKPSTISVEPIREFLRLARFPGEAILGEDPRDATPRRNVPFSAAPITIAGNPAFLYVTLLSRGSGNVYSLFGRLEAARVAIISGSTAILVMALLGLLLFRVITRRFREMTRSVRRFAAGELHQHIEARSDDEVGELASAFNQMASTIRTNIETLKGIDEQRREFVAGISHDIRGPLTCVQGFLETLHLELGANLPPEGHRYIEVIGNNISHLRRLADDLFELSKLEATDAELRREVFPVDELADEIMHRCQLVAAQKGVTLVLASPDDRVLVWADPHLLHRVLGNLVDNAVRYTDAGGTVTLEIRRLVGSAHVRIAVRDTGFGIPANDQRRVFERFYRVDAHRSKSIAGSGLGLAIVKRILDLHGSVCMLESEPGVGTEFSFQLPEAAAGA